MFDHLPFIPLSIGSFLGSSGNSLQAIDVARVLGDLLDRFSIDARLLQVEITESAIAHNLSNHIVKRKKKLLS